MCSYVISLETIMASNLSDLTVWVVIIDAPVYMYT
jgi:hypothetical protein